MNSADTMKPGHELGSDGELVGRDPRKMTAAELGELGHKRMSPLKALRLRCVDCCGGSPTEVRLCTAVVTDFTPPADTEIVGVHMLPGDVSL